MSNMKFTDFKPGELIGKKVLISCDGSSEIKTITRITKTSFGFDDSDRLFDFNSGRLRGGNIWHMTTASLITDEKAAELTEKWRVNNIVNSYRKFLLERIPKLSNENTIELYNKLNSLL